MKKFLPLLLALFSLAAAHAQDAINLDAAVQEIADYLDARLEAKTNIAVLNISSEHQELSGYIIDALINTCINRGNLVPVDRLNIEFIRQELALQLSGDVSDESAQAIGKLLGAQTIISGEIYAANKMYRLGIRAISVETAAIQGTVSKNIIIDKKIKTLTSTAARFPIGIGIGAHIGGTFLEGVRKETGWENVLASQGWLNSNYTLSEINTRSEFDIGAFLFFDIKYAEINASWQNGWGKSGWTWSKDYANRNIPAQNKSQSGNFAVSSLNIGILAKYPFYLNRITLFPAIGADYQLWLLSSENGIKISGDLSARNAVWIKAGGGLDYAVSSKFFIRGELLWGVKLNSKDENRDSFSYFTHKPAVNIGIGYVLNSISPRRIY